MNRIVLACLFMCVLSSAYSQKKISTHNKPGHRCSTMEMLDEAIKKDPSLIEKWKAEGEKKYQSYLLRLTDPSARSERTEAGEIIIPVVFHIVDNATVQSEISDRDIYDQVEALNRDYSGKKMDQYKNVIPAEIQARVGRVPVKFVLARRSPTGALTSGIERRTGTTPSRVNIKSTANGGLDAWETTKYLNIWCGTFSGADAGLLGIATFPFTTTEGPQGVVIGSYTILLSSTPRSYYPNYSEGATLPHEVGHYLYLYHTFGDQTICNNNDFRIQAGNPLPTGAGPEGDDTPNETGATRFGNPSMNYAGCTTETFGEMYGSFMNYYDDRALFMFSNGQRKRVEGCINVYRPGLLTTDGGTAPVAVTDAYLVDITPRGSVERINFQLNNTPLHATIRNYGTSALNSVTVSTRLDGGAAVTTVYPVTLAPGADTILSLGNIAAAAGNHTLRVFTSAPNGTTDNFLQNDTIVSFFNVIGSTITMPFTQDFTSATFPPANWQLWNPNGGASTWTRSATDGFSAAGAAFFDNWDIEEPGTLDELVLPAINLGGTDTATLSFRVAHQVYDAVDPSTWDGLEVYISSNGGKTYTLVYKKTGNQLRSVAGENADRFRATPAQPDRWKEEQIILSPYLVAGQPLLIKFRSVNAYGNSLFIDDISLSKAPIRDIRAVSLAIPDALCSNTGTANLTGGKFTFRNEGLSILTTAKVNYRVDNGTVASFDWTGSLAKSAEATVDIPAINGVTTGVHTLTVYTSNPNGGPDQVPANDTIRRTFTVIPVVPVNPELREEFTSNTFPPAGWTVGNPNGDFTWQRTGAYGKKQNGAAWFNDYNNATSNRYDDLRTPGLTYTNVDSVFLTFQLAAATYSFPGITGTPIDTLTVLLSKDCGNTFTTVYKKWGADLQTLGDPNNPQPDEFFPTQDKWRRDSINIGKFLSSSESQFQVIFRFSGNFENNIFLDDVNIFTKVVPAKVKTNGYMIAPNPVREGQTFIHHYLPPVNLRGIQLIASNGQVVWTQQYNGNASSLIPLDLSRFAAGIYTVRMHYTDKVVTERIVKTR